MDRISLAFARLIFFVMLFVSTACNKFDHSLTKEGLADTSPAASSLRAEAESTRLRELEARVASLESELKAANHEALASLATPGGAYWD